ncbi:MAG: hypothetical protein WCI39_07215 [Gallionellaceae bacterium]
MKMFKSTSNNVGKRVFRYLHTQTPSRVGVPEFIDGISRDIPSTVVFGGMIRDFSLGTARSFNSDIDLVSMADRADILAVIRKHNPVMNKFGGYRFAVGRQLFDIWSFQDTWAVREGLVKADTFEDLCLTTFFNLDGVCQPLTSSKIISAQDYFYLAQDRTLDVQLNENPAPEKIASRAIRMLINSTMKASPQLQLYILKNARKDLWRSALSSSVLRHLARHQNEHPDLPYAYGMQSELFLKN